MEFRKAIKHSLFALLAALPLLTGCSSAVAQTQTTSISQSGNNATANQGPASENSKQQPQRVTQKQSHIKALAHQTAMSRVGMPTTKADHIFLKHNFFNCAFSKTHNNPAWVMWLLTPDMTQGPKPERKFKADEKLPLEHRVEPNEFQHNITRLEKGHMMPAADCKFSLTAAYESCEMSNICPQTRASNSGPWNTLEQSCRAWAKAEDSIYIVCGPVYYSNTPKKIGIAHQISVPDAFFKVVLSLRPGHEKMLGVISENNDSPDDWRSNVRTVNEIETITGLTFFPNLPAELAKRLKATEDARQWKGSKQQNRPYDKTEYNKNRQHQQNGQNGFKSEYYRGGQNKGGSTQKRKQLWNEAANH